MLVIVAHAYLTAMRERMPGRSDVIARCLRVFPEQFSHFHLRELVRCGYPSELAGDRFHRHR